MTDRVRAAIAVALVLATGRTSSAENPWSDADRMIVGEPDYASRVDVAGDLMVVATPAAAEQIGILHVLVRDGSDWFEEATLYSPDGLPGDGFGLALATDGETILVGAPWADTAYFFGRDPETSDWILQHRLQKLDTFAFGSAVDVDGDRAVVTAPGVAGAVVLRFVDGSWNNFQDTVSYLEFEDCNNGVDDDGDDLIDGDDLDCAEGAFSGFGNCVAIDGDRLVVAASAARVGESDFVGRAFVFHRGEDNAWRGEASLDVAGLEANDLLGHSCAIEADRVLLGAPAFGPRGGGAAYLFRRSDASWSRAVTLLPEAPAENGRFGKSVSLHGSLAAVGELSPVGGSGAVHTFEDSPGAFKRLGLVENPEPTIAGSFGWTVAVGEDLLVVGAPSYMSEGVADGGAAFVFARQRAPDEDDPPDDTGDDPSEEDPDSAVDDDQPGFYGCRASGGGTSWWTGLLLLAALLLRRRR